MCMTVPTGGRRTQESSLFGDTRCRLAMHGGGSGCADYAHDFRDTANAKKLRLSEGRPYLPGQEGISEYCITSDGFFDMETFPDVVVVIGAGYIAVELAGILNALGSEVHLILRNDKPLRSFDPMLCDGIDVEMRRAGIFVHSRTGGVSKVVLDAHAGNNSMGKRNVTSSMIGSHAQYGISACDER